MISVRTALHVLLITSVAAVGHAQDSHSGKPETTSSTSAVAKKQSSSPDQVIMKVGGVQVTRKEFESSIGDFEPKGGDAEKAAEVEKNRRRLGDDYASVLMLSQLAVANHLDASPEIRQKLAIARIQILSDAEFSTLLGQTKPSAEELGKYYAAHGADFDRVQVRRLFIWKVGEGSKNTRGLPPAEAKARAAAILQESASQGDAERLAALFNQSDKGLFDIQPLTFTRGQLPASMNKVAFTMKVGTWAEAEDTPDRVILL